VDGEGTLRPIEYVLLAAGKHLVTVGRPSLYADSGVENVNSAVDATLFSACLERILAQVDVAFSNSLIEACRCSLKRQWLFLNTLDSVARVRAMVEFHVNEDNTKMPHPATCLGSSAVSIPLRPNESLDRTVA